MGLDLGLPCSALQVVVGGSLPSCCLARPSLLEPLVQLGLGGDLPLVLGSCIIGALVRLCVRFGWGPGTLQLVCPGLSPDGRVQCLCGSSGGEAALQLSCACARLRPKLVGQLSLDGAGHLVG